MKAEGFFTFSDYSNPKFNYSDIIEQMERYMQAKVREKDLEIERLKSLLNEYKKFAQLNNDA